MKSFKEFVTEVADFDDEEEESHNSKIKKIMAMQQRDADLRNIHHIKSGLSAQFSGHKGLAVPSAEEKRLREKYPEHFKGVK